MRPFILLILLAGCSDFPDFGGAASPAAMAAPPPRIIPIDGLILAAIGPSRAGLPQSPEEALAATLEPLDARIAALRARASILRDAPVDASTRAKLASP